MLQPLSYRQQLMFSGKHRFPRFPVVQRGVQIDAGVAFSNGSR